jgi:TadE-like protein
MLKGTAAIRGAAAVEFQIVALFALLPLCLGLLQTALLLVARHQVDYASYWSARAGAVAHGDMTDIQQAFGQAMSPLFIRTAGGVDRSNVVERVAEAYPQMKLDLARYARISIVAPDSAARADFGIERDGHQIIPNDSLEHRSTQTGRRSGQSLQEANLLKVAVTWCHPLIVPLVSQLLIGTLRRIDADPWDQLCYSAGRVPLRSTGIASMQSDFRLDL